MQSSSLPARLLARAATTTPVRLALFLAVATFAGWAMLQQAGGMNEFHDAQFLSAYERNARLATLHFKELPLWDPYSCGGMYGLAAPQTRYASPFFLVSLLFGVDRGSSLLAVLLPAIGMEGMFRWTRRWGALPTFAFLMAPLFPLSGWFAYSWHWGWVHFESFCLLPWILYGLRGALRGDKRGAVLCAIAVAVTVGFAGTYTLPMAVVPVLGELIDALLPRLSTVTEKPFSEVKAIFSARAASTLRGLAWSAPLVIGLGAYRLWPMVESIGATLRVMGGEPKFSIASSLQALNEVATPSNIDVGHFYLAPVVALGALALPLGLRGGKPVFGRGVVFLWLAAVVSFALALGHIAPNAPFALLRRLPIYETLRYPERYLLLFGLLVPVLAARGGSLLAALLRRFTGRWGVSALAVIALCAVAWGVDRERTNSEALVTTVRQEATPVVDEARAADFHQSRGNRWMMSHFAAEGLGSIACGEAYPVPMSRRLRGDLPQEEYLEDATAGTVTRDRWSPNHLALTVSTTKATRLFINQNWHPGWKSDVGQVVSAEGLLAVELPAGSQTIHVDFRPRSGLGGLFVSLVSLVCGLLWLRGPASVPGLAKLPAPVSQGVLVTAGPLLLALLLAVWREPAWTRPPPETFDRQPVRVASVPADAVPLRTTFDAPIVLEGARMEGPTAAHPDEAIVELYLRRTGKLSANLGLFVHLGSGRGQSAQADHAEISGSVYLAKMELDAIYKDRFRVALPPGASGTWTAKAGFWNAYGDGERRKIRLPGAAEREGDAVIAGTFTIAPLTVPTPTGVSPQNP
jgi:hypothetical protein